MFDIITGMANENPTHFEFSSGRTLLTQPDGTPLSQLYRAFSSEVVDACERENIVLAGGESGLGKSELLLGLISCYRSATEIRAGGITDILREQGLTYQYMDSFGGIEKIKVLAESDGRPVTDYLLIDEIGAFAEYPEEYNPILLKNLVRKGYKLVLMGGGPAHPDSYLRPLAQALSNLGLEIKPGQILHVPPYQLNDLQCEQLLSARYSQRTIEEVTATVEKLRELKIPTILRVLLNIPGNLEVDPVSLENFHRHINAISENGRQESL
ncbi:MAG: hypothetical protein PHS86_03540 [Syntrophaceae bacterium]|nr:hypothetical protein [Syntrophaceae bacterium]